ncbi:fumarylacetoacetate hydrolase family protein [Streptomyces sp. NPDC096311]|uniref:fumarylacetoacetate hydrolase family protein n=1 Tax=Streptomyces sp. NPDC096311 TaxID=3366083 RepID=UPI0037F56157
MSTSVLRTADAWWVLTSTGAARVDTHAATTAELLADRKAVEAAASSSGSIDAADLALVSPVTGPGRVIAQMTNFVSHVRDTNGTPDTVPLTFFRKASGSISGPFDDVIRPEHVRLLDYEAEIGLVIGREMPVGTKVTEDNLSDYAVGLVVTNDVSARDIQLSRTQFYEAKSYPTFTPVGPALVLLDADEFRRFTDLRLKLWVNGELRQNMTAADMIYQPGEALQGLTRFQHLDPGDLVLTGTPVGTAISAPPKAVHLLASLLPQRIKWRLFLTGQARNPKYLKHGDIVEVTVATDDGAIDLGGQRTVVRDGLPAGS